MSYHSRLAYDIWERENYYADDDCTPSGEAPEEPAPAAFPYQRDELPAA